MHSACTTHISNKPQIALARACHCFSTESSQIGLANSMYPCHSAVFNGCGTAGQALSIRHQALGAQTISRQGVLQKQCIYALTTTCLSFLRWVLYPAAQGWVLQKVCRWSRVRDLTAIFFYWNKTDCWLLYAYVLVYASMYWYITVITLRNSIKRVCSSMQQYVLVHTSTYYQWYSLFQYVPVHTCTYMYILVHTSYWIR